MLQSDAQNYSRNKHFPLDSPKGRIKRIFMKALIVGGTGLISAGIVKHLRDRGAEGGVQVPDRIPAGDVPPDVPGDGFHQPAADGDEYV